MEKEKQKVILHVVVATVFCLMGIANIVMWYKEMLGIYGLVFGVFWVIVAGFVFHFRRTK